MEDNLYDSCVLVLFVPESMACLTNTPVTTPLPEFRFWPSPPFIHTGMDFAGPLFVKATGVQENGEVWTCLYTCCVVRAVHLDPVLDITAEAFIQSFKRFTARRGFPQQLDLQICSKDHQGCIEPPYCPAAFHQNWTGVVFPCGEDSMDRWNIWKDGEICKKMPEDNWKSGVDVWWTTDSHYRGWNDSQLMATVIRNHWRYRGAAYCFTFLDW